MNTRHFLLAAAALMAAACSNDERSNPQLAEADNLISLTSSVGGLTRASDGLLAINFPNDTKVKVQVTDNATSDAVTYDPVEYTADGNGGLDAGANKQFYPVSGSTVDIYAYYPSNAASAFEVASDQSDDDAYKTSDLMWAKIMGISKTSTDEQRKLTFSHKLSKIVVTLQKGDGISDDEINAAALTLKSVKYKGTFTASTGGFTADDATQDIIIANNAGTTAHAAIVVPQDMGGKELEIKIGSATKTYTFPASSNFAVGTHNDYTITVKKSGIAVTSSIGTWNNGTALTPDPVEI